MIYIHDKWYKGRLIFDFDGVICVNGSKKYSRAEPYEFSVQQINQAYAQDWYIIIFTARYMLRYKGNLKEVIDYGQKEAEAWLRKFGVKFHEVILGKPSGDLYVDDRGCRVLGENGEKDWNDNFWPLVKDIEDKNADLRLLL